MMTTQYSNALTEVRNATAKYNATVADFRARKVDEDAFFAAKAEYAEAERIFDVAYNAEAAHG